MSHEVIGRPCAARGAALVMPAPLAPRMVLRM